MLSAFQLKFRSLERPLWNTRTNTMCFVSFLCLERMDPLSSSEAEMGQIWFKIHILRSLLFVTKTDRQTQTANLLIVYRAQMHQHTPAVYALSAWLLRATICFIRNYFISGGLILNNTIEWRQWCAVIPPTLSKFTVNHVGVSDVLSCWECFHQPDIFFFLLSLFPMYKGHHGTALL